METGGTNASGGSGGAGQDVPFGWRCTATAYGDGRCDCGCGVRDSDCASADATSCESCAATGSCARGSCSGTIAPNDNAHCAPPPRWQCDPASYGDGKCNCGCGVVDIDCADNTISSCESCDAGSCSPFGCEVFPDDNSQCPKPPPLWSCSERLYRDGVRCDCGCGSVDPDCETAGVESCDKCDAPGSCSAQACPSFIEPKSNGLCYQPSPPPQWSCPPGAYGDGGQCDCGCSVPDPDCHTNNLNECARCWTCGGHGVCEGTILPEDTTQCAPPPPAWTCSAKAFRDSICDCGCGLLDSYCQDIELRYVCENYPVEGCSGGHRALIDPNHNYRCNITVPAEWTCDRSYYDDGFCDCGCGVIDLDCSANDIRSCDACNTTGSCSSAACPGTIAATDIAHCAP